jgi:sugar-specific transcriptional regulator TrmB
MTQKSFNEDEINSFLFSLELTKYETKVFLTLLQHGPQNYRDIAKRSNVPLGKIYYTLECLSKKGWAKILQNKPKLFHSVDPEKILQMHLARINKQRDDLEILFHKIIPQLAIPL